MLKKWSCVSALFACLFAQGLNARSIFVASPDPSTATLSLFTTEPFLFAGTTAGPAGANQVIAGTGGKYYVIGLTAADAVTVLQGAFPALSISKRIPLPGVPAAAVLSPDGRRLVISHAAGVQIIDTATDAALTATTGLNLGTGTPSVAISSDSRRLFIGVQAQRRVQVLNLENGASAGEFTVDGEPVALSVGPNTLLYVSVRNAIYEYDPISLELRGTFSLNGTPGPLSFTPDGKLAIAPNNLTVLPRAAFILDLVRRTVGDVPLSNGVTFNKIVVGDNATAYALSNQTNRIYFINLLSPGSAASFYNVSGITLEGVRDIALSNERPQSRSLVVLTGGELYKIDVANGTFVGPLSAPANGLLSFAPQPIVGPASTLLPINASQTLTPGSTSLPLRIQAVNNEGVPVSGLAVTFATEAAGVTLTNVSATTDQFGYAQATANIPTSLTAGLVTVTATASGQSTSFAVNVTSNNPGPGPGPEPSTGKLEIVLGQGQVTSVGYPTTQPLTIRSLDPSGRPQAGLPITWTVVEGGGALGSASTITDDKGIGTAVFSNFFVQLGVSAVKSVVSATVGSDTVNFIVTTIPNLPNGNRGEAQFFLRKPTDRVIVARAGETLPGAIEIGVGSLIGGGVPNIGLRLEAQNTGGPSATCRDGVPLSDNSGTLVCDLIAGPVVGETELKAYVGESGVFTFTLRVEPGVASTLRITGGNNQSGSTGQALQNAFAVQVTDAGGNPLRGATVTWEVVSTGTATVNPATTTTDENGRTSTRVTLGQQPGLVQIRARSGTGTVTFSATAAGAATGLTVTGGGQSAAAGAAFSQPITVTVSNGTTAIPNATVQFSVTQGSATVPPSAVTNSNGVATVNVTAGATPGPVVIRATYGALSQNINLTVNAQGPVFSAASFVSGAGYQPGISPGSIAVINATGIARDIRGSVTPQSIIGPLPTTLAGVEVLFNGVRAPIYSVSNINGQESVIVQVPFETGPGNASVTIRVAGAGETTVSAIPIQAVKPSFFDFVDTNSRRYVVALRPDGSYVTSTNPARRGETVRVFATGLGQTTPLASTNRLGVRDQNVNALVIAGINNEGVRLVSAKMVEGSVGVYVVEMEIPTTATTGDARPIAIGVAGPDGALVYAGGAIPIQ